MEMAALISTVEKLVLAVAVHVAVDVVGLEPEGVAGHGFGPGGGHRRVRTNGVAGGPIQVQAGGIELPNVIGPREISGVGILVSAGGIGLSHQVAANLHLHLGVSATATATATAKEEKQEEEEEKEERIGGLKFNLAFGVLVTEERGDGVGGFIPKEGKKRLMSGKTESEREKQ